MTDQSDQLPKLLESPLMRHILMFTAMAFTVGVAWNSLASDQKQHARELDTYRAANALALADIRTRLSAVETENVRDRERFYELSTVLTEMRADLRFLRTQVERSSQPVRP
jgi:hypothetical protein